MSESSNLVPFSPMGSSAWFLGYQQDCLMRDATKATVDAFLRILRQFTAWVAKLPGQGGQFVPSPLTTTSVERYLSVRKRAGVQRQSPHPRQNDAQRLLLVAHRGEACPDAQPDPWGGDQNATGIGSPRTLPGPAVRPVPAPGESGRAFAAKQTSPWSTGRDAA